LAPPESKGQYEEKPESTGLPANQTLEKITMKTQKNIKTLRLNRETLRLLTNAELQHPKGGAIPTWDECWTRVANCGSE
jgi:hypothetical protein